jgi:hypothetical protein
MLKKLSCALLCKFQTALWTISGLTHAATFSISITLGFWVPKTNISVILRCKLIFVKFKFKRPIKSRKMSPILNWYFLSRPCSDLRYLSVAYKTSASFLNVYEEK